MKIKIILLLCFTMVPIAAQASVNAGTANPTSLSSGLVGYWPFDGSTINWKTNTATDVSGQTNNCTLTAMPTSTSPVTGKIGQALRFNSSSSWCQLTASVTNPELDIAGDVTVSAWIYPTGGSATSDIVRAGQGADTRYSLFFDSTNKRLQFYWYDGAAFQSVVSSNNSVLLNRWTHAVAVRSGSVITFYVNGVAAGGGAFTSAPVVASIFTIGGTNSGGQPFVGSIDDVRVYNRALGVQEVAQLYKLGLLNAGHSNTTSLSSGLVGYWPLDGSNTTWTSATAGTVKDFSANNNPGTLFNMNRASSPVVGKIGQALTFDGTSQYISISAIAPLAITTGTLSAWIKTSNAGTGYRGIVQKTSAYGMYLVSNIFAVYDNGAGASRSTGVALNDNKWHHVVASFQSGVTNGTSLYIDGALSLVTTLTATGQGAVNIGMGQGGVTQIFNGSIDDVRVYNRVLSAQEVQQLYAQGGGVNAGHSNTTSLSSGLVGYWGFDGSNTNWKTGAVTDLSGNGNTGSLVGMSTTTSPVTGKIGQALKFDGSSSYVDASVASLNFANTTFSVSFWEKGSSGASTFIMANAASGGGWGFQGNGTTFLKSVANAQSTYVASGPTQTKMTNGAWHHVVYVITTNTTTAASQSVTMYIDNALDTGSFDHSTTYGAQTDLTFGSRAGGVNKWVGTLDDVRIYNRALSAQEIAQLYAMGK